MDDHPEPLDADPRLYRRPVRYDISLRTDSADDEGRAEPAAEGDLRTRPDDGRVQFHGQPRQPAVQRSGPPQGDDAGDGPQGVYRHPFGGARPDRRGDAVAAARPVGSAAGN